MSPRPPVRHELTRWLLLPVFLIGWLASAEPLRAQFGPAQREVRPVDLEPASQPAGDAKANEDEPGDDSHDIGRWSYRVEHDAARDGVPWRLIATPLSELAERLRPAETFYPKQQVKDVPAVRVPDNLWPQWFPGDMQDVVGIHYHQFLTTGEANILITVHKVPTDGPDGKPAADYAGRPGTRLEATLMQPLTIYLDQTIVARAPAIGSTRKSTLRRPKRTNGDPPHLRKQASDKTESVDERTAHERGHGEQSLSVLISALAGPQTWNTGDCTGQRSALSWYWEPRKVTRRWSDYHGGTGKLPAQRIAITLVPPTRWSKLIPLPPDDVSQKQIEAFNDWCAFPEARFIAIDKKIQAQFHAQHGQFE